MDLLNSSLSCKKQVDIAFTFDPCSGRRGWGGVADLAHGPENNAAHHLVKLSEKCKLNLYFQAIFTGEHGFGGKHFSATYANKT